MKKRTWLTFSLAGTIFLLVILSSHVAGIRPAGGTLSGRVYGYNMYDEAMPLVWARVSAYENESLIQSVPTGVNGTYIMFLPSGLLNVTVQCPGFKTQARFVAISDGGSSQLNFYLERSEIPIPEFDACFLPILAVLLLAFTTALTRRKHP